MSFLGGRKPPLATPANIVATKRIKKEIADLAKENLGSITLTPNESNIFTWRATIPGPAGSPYEGGVFDVDIHLPETYPFAPPQLQFKTKVYHCNINSSGGICLDLLKNAWSPALSLYKVILSLSSLLTDPNPADPLVPMIAQELRRNKKKHDDTAREWTQMYAKPKSAPQLVQTQLVPPPVSRTNSATRPKPISRQNTPSSSSAAPPQIAGTRRSHAQIDGGSGSVSGSGGTNRANGSSRQGAIDLADESDDDEDLRAGVAESSDVELVSGSSRANGRANGSTSTSISGDARRSGTTETRRSKRTRTNGNGHEVGGSGGGGSSGYGEGGTGAGTGGDDVIVVDD